MTPPTASAPLTSGEIRTLARLDALEAVLRTCFEMIRSIRQEIRDPLPEGMKVLTPVGESIQRLQRPVEHVEPVEPPDSSWIPILHDRVRPDPQAPHPCGGVGLYLTEPPREHQKARLDVMRILAPGERSWRTPTIHDEPRCSSCRALINPFSNTDLDYLSHMQPAALAPTSKKRGRDRSGGDRSLGGEGSPGSPDATTDRPPTYPGHVPEAEFSVGADLARIQKIAESAGLFDDVRLRERN